MNKQQFIQQYFGKSSREMPDKMLAVLWVVGAGDKLAQLGMISGPGRRTLDMEGGGPEAWQIIHDNRKDWIETELAVSAITALVTDDIFGNQESEPTDEQMKNCTGAIQLLISYFDDPERMARFALDAMQRKC